MGVIYLATCKVNGKQYVGKSKTDMTARRDGHRRAAKKGSKLVLHCAIRKYGWENFEWDVVEENVAEEDLDKMEIENIKWFRSKVPKGYNMTDGGDGGATFQGRKHTPETKLKMSQVKLIAWESRPKKAKPPKLTIDELKLIRRNAALEVWKQPGYLDKWQESHKHYWSNPVALEKRASKVRGRKQSEEEKAKRRKPKPEGFGEKVSKALKGRKKSKEAVINVANAKRGKKLPPHSPETKLAISLGVKKHWADKKAEVKQFE